MLSLKQNMEKNIIAFILLWVTQINWAQSVLSHFEYLTISEGLPHNTVYCSLQDKNGFIWFGTQDGLARYDGYECRTFRQSEEDTVGFLGKSIHSILEDKKGNLWIGTQTNGINFRDINTGKFKNLGNNDAFKSISKNWINAIVEDDKGLIWVGSAGGGILIYDPKSQKSKLYNSNNSDLKSNYILKIIQDGNGKIWVATSGTGIYYFDDKKQDFTLFHSIKYGDTDFNSFRKTFFSDKKGNLWVGTEGSGLYKIDLKTLSILRYTIKNGLSSNNVTGIAANDSEGLLITTDGGGLNILNLKTNQFSHILYDETKSLINTNALLNILVDSGQNLWLGTYNGGVNVYKPHRSWFETLTRTGKKSGELSQRSVLSVCKTTTNQILVGTDGGGLNLYDKKNKTFTLIPNNPVGFGNVVKTIFEDSKKRVWLGYFNEGMSQLEMPSMKAHRVKIQGNNVWSIAESENGDLNIGILGGGVSVICAETGHALAMPRLSSDDIITQFEDKSHQLWIGTATQGLNLWDRKRENCTQFVHQNNNQNSISANDVRCIFQDSKSRTWIGTESGGLNLWLGNGKFQHFTTNEGLISNSIMSILEDKQGFLWISTFNGLCRIMVDSLSISQKNRGKEEGLSSIINFDFRRNLHSINNQFNQASAMTDENGTLYFGGINGLTIVEPDLIHVYEKKPQIAFTDFKIFNKSISNWKSLEEDNYLKKPLEETSDITLSYKDNVFSLEFTSLDFTNPFENKFQYKLEGFDKQWISSSSDQRLVTYTNLDPKTYFFKVKGSNNYGIWSDEKILKITITPPFWKTWWFNLLVLLFTFLLGRITFKFVLKRRELALKQKILQSESSLLALKNEKLSSDQIVLNLQNEKLANEIKSKNTELMSKAAQMAYKNESLLQLKEQISDITSATVDVETLHALSLLKKLKSTLNTEIESEKSWEQFSIYFDEVNQNFTAELLKKHPQLTQNDLRMCALTRLNMSNKEMAALLGITVTGVEKSRYRLKKRLELKPEDNLDDFLRNFAHN